MRKTTRTTPVPHQKWDLWTQETEAEREMALFFLDIRNFTSLAEKHQAVDVIHIVKKIFATFQNIIRVYRGRIIETTGDGFYAAFGFDGNVREAVNAAVQAGIIILENLESLNMQSFEKNLQQRIDIGIGVHVGKVACDTLRVNAKDHVVVMGYPVNVASRLQAATKELNNNFIISADDVRIIYIINVQELKGRIVVHIIIQLPCAQGETRNCFIGMNSFILVVDHILFKKVYNAVAAHFRMHPKILIDAVCH